MAPKPISRLMMARIKLREAPKYLRLRFLNKLTSCVSRAKLLMAEMLVTESASWAVSLLLAVASFRLSTLTPLKLNHASAMKAADKPPSASANHGKRKPRISSADKSEVASGMTRQISVSHNR